MTTPAQAPLLQVHDLHFAYPDQAPLLAGWSAQVPAGITVLRGDSGSGKSTLLRLLAGVQPGAQGRVTLAGGLALSDGPVWQRQVFWREPGADADDTRSPTELVQAWRQQRPDLDPSAWLVHVEGFSLAPHVHKPMLALSTGTRRKLGLAVALSSTCPLVLLDEPTAGLDAPSIAYLARVLADVAARGGRSVWLAMDEAPAGVPVALVIDLDLLR
jgi:ABC-type multidrug transport system ATPase subunit